MKIRKMGYLLIFLSVTGSLLAYQKPIKSQYYGTAGRYIINSTSGKCLDSGAIPAGSERSSARTNESNSTVQLWDCDFDSKRNQKWVLTKKGFLVSVGTGNRGISGEKLKCLDVVDDSTIKTGAKVELGECKLLGDSGDKDLKTDQQWQLRSGFFMNLKYPGKCLDIAELDNSRNGLQLQLSDCQLSGVNPDNGEKTAQRFAFSTRF